MVLDPHRCAAGLSYSALTRNAFRSSQERFFLRSAQAAALRAAPTAPEVAAPLPN